jgi:hypothetical protein
MKTINILISLILLSPTSNLHSQSQEELSLNEFIKGQVNKFSSNGAGKSNGLMIHLKYPRSWKSIEGEHPHVVRKFVQPDNYASAMVLVNKLDNPLTTVEINEFFTEELKSIVPESSNVLSMETNLKIEGLQAGSIDFSTSAVRMNRLFNSYCRFYVFIYKNYFVMIQFMVVNKIDESNQSVLNRYNTLKPLFYQIFNSIVIDNIWV